MLLPIPPVTPHFVFLDELGFLPRTAFAFAGRVWCGGSNVWQRDEAVWDFRRGKYRGDDTHFFLRAVPAALRAAGALEELFEGESGSEPLVRLPESGPVTAEFETLYADNPGAPTLLARPKVAEVRLHNALGALVQTRLVPWQTTTTVSLESVPNGSYLLWARVFDAQFGDPAFPANDPRNSGQWSAVRLQIGAESWSANDGIQAGPTTALWKKASDEAEVTLGEENTAPFFHPFDVLAQSVSASCLTTRIVRNAAGQIEVPAGSLVMGGIRASRSGPQSALWLLREDGSARVLATSDTLSNGLCECGKSDHHASDVQQDTDGTLYLLSECSLHRYNPDEEQLHQRLPGEPLPTHGEPGGQSLHFYEGRKTYSTELLTAPPTTPGFGPYTYNRLVGRIGNRDETGPGTFWHGPNNLELYGGRLWSARISEANTSSPTGLMILDTLSQNRWSEGGGVRGGIQRPSKLFAWRHLKRRGAQLWVWGYAPGEAREDAGGNRAFNDAPLCALIENGRFYQVDFPFFVRRVTRSMGEDGRETLLCVVSSPLEGNGGALGFRARRVVELATAGTIPSGPRGGPQVCAFWNAQAKEFRMTRVAFIAAGGDPDKLPPFLIWRAQSGANGGGVWVKATSAPVAGYYLQLDLSGGALIRYAALKN